MVRLTFVGHQFAKQFLSAFPYEWNQSVCGAISLLLELVAGAFPVSVGGTFCSTECVCNNAIGGVDKGKAIRCLCAAGQIWNYQLVPDIEREVTARLSFYQYVELT